MGHKSHGGLRYNSRRKVRSRRQRALAQRERELQFWLEVQDGKRQPPAGNLDPDQAKALAGSKVFIATEEVRVLRERV